MRRPWNSLARFLRLPTHPRTSARRRPPKQRLYLESLEDRTVPTVVYNSAFGGDTIFWVPGNSAGKPANQVQIGPIASNPSVLNNPTVYLDFWGDSWTETNSAPLANAAQAVIQSRFFSQLSDYGFHGAISYGGYTIDNTHTSDGNTVGDPQNGQNVPTEIQNLLNGKLATDPNLPTSSWLRPPDNKVQDAPIYIVVYDNGANAFNTPAHYTSSLLMNEISIGDANNDPDLFTDLFSHEMAERISAGDLTGIEMNASTAISGEFQNAQISDNEPDGSRYTYRINGPSGQLVQAYWSLTFNGFAVPDGNRQIVHLNPNWASGSPPSFLWNAALTITGGQLVNPNDTITLGETLSGGVSVTLNGELFQFDNGRINDIFVTTSHASSAINVLATPAGTSTFLEDQGNDTVVVGNSFGNIDNGAGFMGNIHGAVAVAANGDIGEPGSTQLFLDDSSDNVGQNVTMNDGEISYGGAAPIFYNPSSAATGDVTYLAVYAGSGGNIFNVKNTSNLFSKTFLSTGTGNDTVNVGATRGGLFDNNPGGNDITNVGLGNTGQLNGFVLVSGNGSTSLTINDSNDTTGRTVTMGDGSVGGLGTGGISWVPTSTSAGGVTHVEVDGGSGGNTFNINNTSSLFGNTLLNTGAFSDTVNVFATQGGLNVVNPGGSDSINVGRGNLGSINGFVNVSGAGATSLDLDDSSDTVVRTVSMNDGSITGLGGGTGAISWTPTSASAGGVVFLYVFGSGAGSTYNVNNTSNLNGDTFLVTGNSNDTVNVFATKGSATSNGLFIINQGGADRIDVGLGSVVNINGFVEATGSGATALLVDDHLDTTARTVTLASGNLTGLGNAGMITYTTGVTEVTINGPSAASTYNIQSTNAGASVAVNGGAGRDTFTLGSSNSLNGIQGALTINGGGSANALNANDSSSASGQSYTLSNTTLTRSGIAPIAYASLATIHVTGSGNDALTLLNPVPTTVATSFNGGSGTNTLQGANATNGWTITGANSGRLDNVFFSNFQDLVGGTGVDVFSFSAASAAVQSINGGGAPAHQGNWLNYSAFPSTSPVTVNLQTGAATGVAGGVANIQNVHGGNGGNTLTGNGQGNILVGGSGTDRITGDTGASLLIGDAGADTITGGSGGDILIGDSTVFDPMTFNDENALMAILAEWQSADSYATRFTDINTGTGGGLNGAARLNFGITVKDDSVADTITAAASSAALDWFFQGTGDVLQHVEPGEHINNNTPAAFQNRTVTSSIPEGSLATVSGTITDPNPGDLFTLVVNWGDGTPAQTYTFPASFHGQRVSVSHRYGDEGSYTIALSWTDPTGPANQATLGVTVTEVVPVVQDGGAVTLKLGGVLDRTGSFNDPSTDTWTATVDYGEGMGPQPLTLQGHSFRLHHKYPHPGTYEVVVTVMDDDGAAGTDAFTVTVS
jgi:hypothetical protein